jgi:hypothetical protein
MPYLERTGGGSVVCYENPQSIRRKCEYAKEIGCAGIMIWHIGADLDGEHAPLMDALAQSCGASPQVFAREILEKQIIDLQAQIRKTKILLNQEPVKTPQPAAAQDVSALPTEQLEPLGLKLEKEWGLLQDHFSQTQAIRHGKP